MSNSGYYRDRKPTWWLRCGDDFIDIDKIRGDDTLCQVLTLPPGDYHLGVGSIKDGVRAEFTIGTYAVKYFKGPVKVDVIAADQECFDQKCVFFLTSEMLREIDAQTSNRSAFVRQAVAHYLNQVNRS
jgi:hypothetical protein